jgi:hypothetical protein
MRSCAQSQPRQSPDARRARPARAHDREQISVALGAIKQEVIEVHQPAQAAAGQQGDVEYPMQSAPIPVHPAVDHYGNTRQSMQCQQDLRFPTAVAARDGLPQRNVDSLIQQRVHVNSRRSSALTGVTRNPPSFFVSHSLSPNRSAHLGRNTKYRQKLIFSLLFRYFL